MRMVIALGGNALLRRGERPSVEAQRRNLHPAMRDLAQLAAQHEIVLTHGNGPQVGLLALQAESGSDTPLPLDVLGAQTQGMIGYLIEDELRDHLEGAREVATLLTQVVVDVSDPAFSNPSKPIGPVWTESVARRIASERGWSIASDGEYWRRVVPSPEPRRILEIGAVRLLLEAGVVVICAGGGGVPVVADPSGGWHGVEAVVDKDLSAALLADQLDADSLLLLTDVDAVYRDWGTAHAQPIRVTTAAEMRSLSFAAGSMGPKVEAACRFVSGVRSDEHIPPRVARIGALADAARLIAGDTGTTITG
jgi:carbamate kinase